MMCADVGGEQRGPDGKEADIAAGEEIVGSGVLLAAGPPNDGDQHQKVDTDDVPVDPGNGPHGRASKPK
jgi:hypothetical protein